MNILKKTLLSSILILTSIISAYAQPLDDTKTTNTATQKLDTLTSKYNNGIVYTSLFFTNKDVHTAYTTNYSDFGYCPLEQEIASFIKSTPNVIKTLTDKNIKLIEAWNRMNEKLQAITPIESDERINFTDVLFHMPTGHFLYAPYLVTPEYNEYYNSIGADNICKLYDDVLSYLTTLNNKQQTEFFNEYTQVYNKLKRADK